MWLFTHLTTKRQEELTVLDLIPWLKLQQTESGSSSGFFKAYRSGFIAKIRASLVASKGRIPHSF